MQCCEYLFYCDYISPAAALNTKRGEGEEEKDKRNITRGDLGFIRPWKELLNPWKSGNMGKPIALPVISLWWIDSPLVFCATMHLCLLLSSFEPESKCFELQPQDISLQLSLQCTQAHYRPIFVVEQRPKMKDMAAKKTALHNLIPFLIGSQRFLEELYQSHRHDIRTYLMSALGFSANVESWWKQQQH